MDRSWSIRPRCPAATGHLSLDWWEASPDGAHVVYGLSRDGSEDSVLHVLRVADGTDLPERIPNTEDAPIRSGSMTAAASSTTSSPARWPRPSAISTARRASTGWGPIPATDPILMKRGLNRGVVYERIQSP